MKTHCYIERYATSDMLPTDIKALIPDATLRRRMSRFVRTGVATAMCCLDADSESGEAIDAIITATGFGCLTDSEKFLRNVIEQREELLNPTPFIQSTFNTIGAQIALLRGYDCYNVTYAHRGLSFESALLDAAMQLDEGTARRILVGAADEQTPSQHRIMERMGCWRKHRDGEGAAFLLLQAAPTREPSPCIEEIDFPETRLDDDTIRRRYAVEQILRCDTPQSECYPTAVARILTQAVAPTAGKQIRIAVCNNYMEAQPSVIVVSC